MAHDKRVYRFQQDTRHGRALIAESERVERMVEAIADYIARRLIERERALASDWRSREADARVPGAAAPANDDAKPATTARAAEARARGGGIGDLFRTFFMMLGALTFCVIAALGAAMVWQSWGRALWSAHLGAPPF
jgi:hypothetical protein